MGMFMRGGGSEPTRPLRPGTLPRIARLFRPYLFQVACTTAAVFASVGLGLLSPFYLQIIINRGLLGHSMAVVSRYSLYTLLATLGGAACSLAFSYLGVVVGQQIMRDLRNQLYRHLQGMGLRFFTNTRTGEIQSRLANDVGGVQSVVSDTAASVLSHLTTVISTLAVMVYMDWRLTLLSVGVLPLFALVGIRVGTAARASRKIVQTRLAALTATMQEMLSVSGVLLTKTSGRGALSLSKFREDNDALTQAQVKQAVILRSFFSLVGLTFVLTPVLVYWLAGYFVVVRGDQHLTIGTIVAFTMLQTRLLFPLTGLMNVQVEVSSALALFDRIFEYLDLEQEITDAPDAVTLTPHEVRGEIAFEDVSFRYEEAQEQPTLSGITFRAEPGQLVALVGHSGAGKTTLTYLIPRLYDTETGRVTIDGHDVRKIKLASLSDLVGVVTQETYLVHDTIRENLRYGRPEATDEEIIAAARAAAIHEHISRLPEGYDTVVGERGHKLSGGERQRVAIARALLKNPRILILDEATSALDTQSERLIQSALGKLMSGRTTFAIAHRLSTILSADLILVLERGEVVERGTHSELLARDGAYARLYDAQFQETERPAALEPSDPTASLT